MSDGKFHPRSMSEREYYTQEGIAADHDRRFSAGDEEGHAHDEGGGSRPVPLPRRANTSIVPSPRTDPERQDGGTWTNARLPQLGNISTGNEIERLQTEVDNLLREQKRLQETIDMMKKREEELDHREQAIVDRERELTLKESHTESKHSDKEFELNQKRRDLQMLEDQLHMKSKDLQHREFDLLNADGPEDISSSKMADLADRTFELDKREEELKRKQENFENWERKLCEDNDNYRRKMSDLQRTEAGLLGSTNTAPTNRVHAYTTPYPAHQQMPPDQVYSEAHRYQEPQHSQDWTQHGPVTSSPKGPADPWNSPSEVRQEPEPTIQQQRINSEGYGPSQTIPFPDNPMPPPSPPQNEPIFSPPPALDFTDDEALARQLAENEERMEQDHLAQRMLADQLLALQLQDEDLMGTDSVASASQLSAGGGNERTEDVIKRDLGSRLTQQHYRQQREKDDYVYAQNLVDETNNSESNN